jgi:hypothetical protein
MYTDYQQYSIETQAVVMQLTPNYIGPTAAKSASQVIRLGSLDLRVFVYLIFFEPSVLRFN